MNIIEFFLRQIIKQRDNGDPVLEQKIQDVLIPKVEDGSDDKSILEHLLLYKPQESHELCNNLMGQIIPNYDENEFPLYLEAKNKGNYRDVAQKPLFQKYFGTLKKILDIFDYDGQLSRNKSRSYKLSMGQGRNTCTYCNRQYVITVNGKNDKERIARPQLDHWFSKELYPLLSLNIYNLIPCCSICNSSIKRNTIFSLDTHIHPYRDLCKTLCSRFAHFIIFLYLYSMKQRPSSPSFADLIVGHRKVKQTFFLQIDQIIDWNPIRGLIEIAYTKGNRPTGRPSYDSLVLFKTELLRTWYGLSDGEVEEQVNDRLSFSRFVGLGLDDCAPDSTTVCRFRNILVEADLYDNVLQEINRQLELAGVLVKRGAIVDASITDSPRRPRGRKEYEVVEDRNEESGMDVAENAMVKEIVKPNVDGEARWVKKMGKLHFGYKRHSVTDENGLVIAEETTPANESDIKHLEKPLEKAKLPQGTPVYADKGYDSTANKDVLKRMKLKSRIMHKGVRGHKLTERELRVNVAISKTRYKVERTFGSIHRWFHGGIARYVGLDKTHAQHIMEAIAYNLYRTPGIIVSNSLK